MGEKQDAASYEDVSGNVLPCRQIWGWEEKGKEGTKEI